MRTSNVIINGVDIFSTYGAIIAKDGYKELIQWPAMKGVSGNDWQEEDGFEPDLSDPRLDSWEFNLTFGINGGSEKIIGFYNFLLSEPKMTYSFNDIGLSLELRVVSMPSLSYAKKFGLISVRFSCDNPLSVANGSRSSGSSSSNDLYVIDGQSISSYGIRILYGTIDNVVRQPNVKPLLTRRSSVIDGAEYDENPVLYSGGEWGRSSVHGSVTTSERDITLHCQLSAGTFSTALGNYYALLWALVAKDEGEPDPTLAGARNIVIRPVGGIYRCYYKSQSVEDFYFKEGKVWIEFFLTLCLFEKIGSVEIDDGLDYEDRGSGGGGDEPTIKVKALATEDNGLVITEDGKVIVLTT